MMTRIAVLAILLALSSCQQFNGAGSADRQFTQSGADTCQVSTNRILSCLSSTDQRSSKIVNSEFDTLFNSWKTNPEDTNLNRLLCFSLHYHSSKEQLTQGKNILEQSLKRSACQQQSLDGLLRIFQGKIKLHKQYLDRNWKLHLENKKISKQNDIETATSQRRIQDLEKQVQKLIEIESMLDQKVQP